MKGPKPNLELREAIRRGYEAGLPLAEIAVLAGTSRKSVGTLARRMGLKYNGPDRYGMERRRGFAIPVQMKSDYLNLRRKGFGVLESAKMLGLEVPA